MAKRIALTELAGSTLDILNVIRQNASLEYQSKVPEVTSANMLPKVGDVLYGTPALANEWVNALVNRIALVRIKSLTFNNPYADLKKGFIEYGETVEEAYVEMAKVREFSTEKASAREMAKTLADVRSAFHAINWQVQYPISVSIKDIRRAFMSESGVTDLINRIIDSTYRAAEYDEFLLFKYLIIKAVTKGKMYPVAIGSNGLTSAAEAFRGYSNILNFVKTDYNDARVHTNTPREDQYIFMDSAYNASFDVNVLASAFHMDKADFMGRLKLIDDWTTFDNDRWTEIRAACDMVEEVTDAELNIMANVKAVLVDAEWFQIYDNLAIMTDDEIAAGLYWNYFYTIEKIVSTSPFANAIVFVANGTTVTPPTTLTYTVTNIQESSIARIYTLALKDSASVKPTNAQFVQTEDLTEDGIAVQPYGAVIIPMDLITDLTSPLTDIDLDVTIGDTTYTGTIQLTTIAASGDDPAIPATVVGDELTFSQGA